MAVLPIGVGDSEAQRRFLELYKPFLGEYPRLRELLKKVFLRPLMDPSPEEHDAVAGLAADHPSVIAFDDKRLAQIIIFYLGRVAVDDFGEIITLAGNGRGVGASKMLRGMYERIVTAAFLSKNPSEARRFAEEEAIQKWKLWQSARKINPDITQRYTHEQIRSLEEEYKAAKAKKAESICKKCRQPKTNDAWTRVDLATMAAKTDQALADLYGTCYQEPTFHFHATPFGLTRRLIRNERDTGWTFREMTEKEAWVALHLAHKLILRLCGLHDDYFGLDLESEIQARIDAFLELWESIPQVDDRGAGAEDTRGA